MPLLPPTVTLARNRNTSRIASPWLEHTLPLPQTTHISLIAKFGPQAGVEEHGRQVRLGFRVELSRHSFLAVGLVGGKLGLLGIELVRPCCDILVVRVLMETEVAVWGIGGWGFSDLGSMVSDGLRDLIGVEGTCLTFGTLSGRPILADHSVHG
ncbi:hypothetical protein BDV38DRAFT_176609 [Aspergillus pseudotamarii]|uniref:Uncharacterized protein n=1 Tax=Aspergillus pseudotamarii TaxID=132259 RepID=A0A5N6T6L1_ASPPS|nr:uncharacterized protein BDV38DRAFT_176609 [Aspergillus pseudotamarii]KAE8141984.1 hypothetical protein BDV38DRAFT_176609 [Aspergillus pseudotamarii]